MQRLSFLVASYEAPQLAECYNRLQAFLKLLMTSAQTLIKFDDFSIVPKLLNNRKDSLQVSSI